jgi:monomeric sarcosine oxidase
MKSSDYYKFNTNINNCKKYVINGISLTFSVFSAIFMTGTSKNEEEYIVVRQQRVIIIGAGIVGLSTALALLAQGTQQVTILEQARVDSERATSHGISRLLRFEYGSDSEYSKMVSLSLRKWRQLAMLTGRTLYTRTGMLMFGGQEDVCVEQSFQVMQELGLPVERLSQKQCHERFPQFNTENANFISYNAEAGILHASTCLQTLKERVIEPGGKIYEACRVTSIDHEQAGRPVCVYTDKGDVFVADRVVLALGPWVHRLLARMQLPVRLTRQYLLYFAGLPLTQYSVNAFPAFMTGDFYGFPMHYTPPSSGYGPYWLKASSHAFGPTVDPDDISPPDEWAVHEVAQRLTELLPGLRQARLVKVDPSMYDVTPDENFILDSLPGDPRIVFATGLSGHGFKFGLLLGELLASLVSEIPPPVPLNRFRLARFKQQYSGARLLSYSC